MKVVEPDTSEVNRQRLQLGRARRIVRVLSVYVDNLEDAEAALERQGVLKEYRRMVS